MKRKIRLCLSVLLLLATESMADVKSLVGLEVGFGQVNIKSDEIQQAEDITETVPLAGIKIGAQSDSYRVFLDAHYYFTGDFEYISAYGVSLQYLFNFSKKANFFLGLNTGFLDAEYKDKNSVTRTFSDTYIGADAGLNYHLNDMIDFEFGARFMDVNEENIKNGVTYTLDPIINGYASVIIKYDLD